MIIEHGFHEHLFGQMHEDCAQGNQDEPKKKKKYTLQETISRILFMIGLMGYQICFPVPGF